MSPRAKHPPSYRLDALPVAQPTVSGGSRPGPGGPRPPPPVVVQAPPVFLGTNYDALSAFVVDDVLRRSCLAYGWPIIGYIAKFIPVIIHETVDTRAAHFGPDVHEIVCRLGLRPRPHWGSLQRPPPDP